MAQHYNVALEKKVFGKWLASKIPQSLRDTLDTNELSHPRPEGSFSSPSDEPPPLAPTSTSSVSSPSQSQSSVVTTNTTAASAFLLASSSSSSSSSLAVANSTSSTGRGIFELVSDGLVLEAVMDSCYGIRSAPGDRCTPINQTSGLAAKTAKYENCLHVLTAAQKANIPYAAVVTPLDINNGNQTAILNLVWGLISFTWLRDKPGSTATDARKTLLDWVNSRIKDSGPPVIDFCHSWHDGTALCRLLNSFIPNSLSPGKLTQDSTGNLLLVLEKISSVLAILPWIESWEAATAMEPEERCIMTYIGEFYNYGRRHNSASVVVVSPAEEKLRREKAQLELEMRQLQHTQSILKVRANETERMLSPVIKEGFLVKQGKVVKSWKRRWFALKQDGLYYFSNRTDWKPLGAIPLSQIVKIGAAEDTKNSSWIVPAHASPYTFVIKSEQRDLYCTCTCESEMQDWINTINTLLERTRT